jgi:hypothetical protein
MIVPDQNPISYQFIIERWSDGLKVLGAGNGAGFLASAASFQYFAANKPTLLFSIKIAAAFFLAGIILFAFAFAILTFLPAAIERFLRSSNKKYKAFGEMMNALAKANKDDRHAYVMGLLLSIVSFICFLGGCLQAVRIVSQF